MSLHKYTNIYQLALSRRTPLIMLPLWETRSKSCQCTNVKADSMQCICQPWNEHLPNKAGCLNLSHYGLWKLFVSPTGAKTIHKQSSLVWAQALSIWRDIKHPWRKFVLRDRCQNAEMTETMSGSDTGCHFWHKSGWTKINRIIWMQKGTQEKEL